MHHGIPAPHPQDMQHLLIRLQEEGYQYVASLCSRIEAYISELRPYEAFDAYGGRCARLTRQAGKYLRLRRLVLIPYIHDLIAKEEDGHDCRTCGTACSVQHSTFVQSIREAHHAIRELIFEIQAGGLPEYEDKAHPEAYRMLRVNMVILYNTLMEILFIEESALIPMMIGLQQKIGAHG